MYNTNGLGRIVAAVGIALALVAAGTAQGAATRTWDGGGTASNWFDAANWDTGVPVAGDTAVIASAGGGVIVTGQTAYLAALTIGTNTLTFSDTTNLVAALRATNVTIRDSGIITHVQNSDTQAPWYADARIYIACSNLTVDAGGAIDAAAKGYPAAGAYALPGYGPGGGGPDQYRSGAGGHGGVGGQGDRGAAGGSTYGSLSAPDQPGSSGGATGTPGDASAGGGIVRIVAEGAVTVNGTITADGERPSPGKGAGGSGGSVYITCNTFAGTAAGLVASRGGHAYNTSHCGAGGGGRIAIDYDPGAQASVTPAPAVQLLVGPGTGTPGDANTVFADPGTVWLADDSFMPPATIAQNIQLWADGLTNWSPDALTVTGVVVALLNTITLSPTNDLLVTTDAELRLPVASVCAGLNVTITNGSELHISSGPTNAAGPAHGARLAATQTLAVVDGSTLYLYSDGTNGGSVLVTASGCVVDSTSTISADRSGFNAGDDTHQNGYGPGGGPYNGSYRGGGAGYGGQGGRGVQIAYGGATYGSAEAPSLPGSGGPDSPPAGSSGGGHGGGLVRVEVTGGLSIDGTVSANGSAHSLGGGSGGGIFLVCNTLSGSGTLRADGGSGNTGKTGGGGGGRISAWRAVHTFNGTVSVTNGVGYDLGDPNEYSKTGTVAWVDTFPVITNLYATNVTRDAAELVGEVVSTGMAPTYVTCYWGTNDAFDVKGNWDTNDPLGLRGVGLVTNSLTGLSGGTLYYYRFYASNTYADTWGEPSAFFSTIGNTVSVDNDGGATALSATSAVLRGNVVLGTPDPDTYVCWGDNDPGLNDTNLWDEVVPIGPKLGECETEVTGLLANKTYYYRCYAENTNAGGWAASATNFTTLSPTISIADPPVLLEGDGGTKNLDFDVTLSATSAVDVTVQFATADGWATSGSDYTATNGTLTFAASNTVAGTVRVVIDGDTEDEFPDEDLYVNLSAPTNATLADAQGRGVIDDDDVVAQTKTWSGTGNWLSRTNWSPTGWPGPGDDAVVSPGAGLELTNATELLASFTITNATLTFVDTTNLAAALRADDVYVRDSGIITHAANTDTQAPWSVEARVYIDCANLTVDVGGSIDVMAKGYPARTVREMPGYGPGAGGADMYRSGGGGHGGRGGEGDRGSAGGSTYGSLTTPDQPGSSGGATGTPGDAGAGGGVIRIAADGAVTVNGTITADGERPSPGKGAGGSGGSVYITCSTFAGTTNGLVASRGGHAYNLSNCGAGGGGRIAIDYDPGAQASVTPVPAVQFLVGPGTGSPGDANTVFADPGTVWLADNSFMPADTIAQDIQLYVDGLASWAPDTLTVTGAVVALLNEPLALAPTNSLTIYDGELRLYEPTVDVGDSILLTNGAILRVYSGPTNAAGPDYGALLDAAQSIDVVDSSTLYLYSDTTNGGSVRMSASDVTVDDSASINADGLGLRAGESGHTTGYGPGGGPMHGSYRGGGGGYGGHGGRSEPAASYGPACGSSNAPALPGSGGPASTASSAGGGHGGGLILMDIVNTVTVDGTLTADGLNYNNGGGSGGGIFIRCGEFSGTGAMRADGGDASDLRSGGGGGGRIAIWESVSDADAAAILAGDLSDAIIATTNETFTGATSVTNGAGHDSGSPAEYSQPGTVVFLRVPPPAGTVFIVR